jgi:hypothetical protein
MMAYRITQKENVFIDHGRTLATWFTFQQGNSKHVERIRIRYVVRVGKKGTGRVLALADCRWGARSQDATYQKISDQLGGIEWMDAVNTEKFEAAGYIPDPYGR